jgi:hypothetical protein
MASVSWRTGSTSVRRWNSPGGGGGAAEIAQHCDGFAVDDDLAPAGAERQSPRRDDVRRYPLFEPAKASPQVVDAIVELDAALGGHEVRQKTPFPFPLGT